MGRVKQGGSLPFRSFSRPAQAVMDKDRSNHVGLQLFLEGCKALGYEDEDEAKLRRVFV